MPSTPGQPLGHTEGLPESTAAEAVLPCGPCIPIMLGLASLTAFFIITTAVLAERLFRRPNPDTRQRAPTLVWRPGGELWIEPTSSARERSEDWYGSSMPLLMDRVPDPPTPGGTLEGRATAPPAPSIPHSSPSSLVPQTPPEVSAQSTFWRPQAQEERLDATGLASWVEPEMRQETGMQVGSPKSWRMRQGSLEPDWGLQPRVTLEQISAFWKREGRTSVGF
ncbi:transmembrane protein C16orf54 homolog [Mesocricetus auratus]|uniref:Transmembrane protein C16orf54 homolog n=1 Tax=Mesocricetus auratus TaxID=10036 RepID=A0ABM2Y586_MESAU|nr:transmembrane protein C16orf54 homolog [Mesocricetus auratus]XP_040610022.1 transmembrane protein C16orf54 homolog [Mesocricetus auratus]